MLTCKHSVLVYSLTFLFFCIAAKKLSSGVKLSGKPKKARKYDFKIELKQAKAFMNDKR